MMNKSQQIETLSEIKTKPINKLWFSNLSSYIKDFFGESSEEYKYISAIKYRDADSMIMNGLHHMERVSQEKQALSFIENCIGIIEKSEDKKPLFLQKIDNSTTIIGSTFGNYNSGTMNGGQSFEPLPPINPKIHPIIAAIKRGIKLITENPMISGVLAAIIAAYILSFLHLKMPK